MIWLAVLLTCIAIFILIREVLMHDQLHIFRDAPARNTDPETSHNAASKVDTSKLEGAVHEALAKRSMTAEEVADYLHLPLQSVSPRFRPLERKGFIRRTKLRRLSHSGHPRIVWELVT